ncbi:MAG: cytochrome b [Nocardioides sp.]
MAWRSGDHGYGWITKVLHWLTVLLVAAQFVVGYSMAAEDACDRQEDTCEQVELGAFDLLELHVLLGLSILVIAVVRPLWRRYDGFPPWSDHLSAGDRRVVHWTERALMLLLFVVPLSGLLLNAFGDDAWLALHIGAHIAFFVALAAHLFTNLRPRILRRML